MKPHLLKLFLLIFLVINQIFGQSLSFFKESIELFIHEKYCTVTGKYYFKNNSNKPVDQMIYYPFSKSYNISKPDSINITDFTNNKTIQYSIYKDGIIFNLNMKPNGKTIYQVVYSQRTPDQKMEYILLTTQEWKKPLEKAEFIVKLAANLNFEYISAKYDHKKITESYTAYFVSRDNYMPDENLVVQWR